MMMNPILVDLPMPIVTPRLILQPPQMGDGKMLNDAVLETYDNLKLTMPWAETKPSIKDSEEIVRQMAANWILKKNEEPYLALFIFNKETQQFIGATGYHHYNWEVPCLETGYWIRTSESGKGYMTEAINALTQYAIKQIGAKRIEIRCDLENIRSKKIPERLVYHLEATLKSNRLNPKTHKPSDTLVYVRHDLKGLPDLQVSWGLN